MNATNPNPYAAGTPVTSRDSNLKGQLLGGKRPCNERGCTGSVLSIKWDNGQVTEPCTTTMHWTQGKWHLTNATPAGDDTLNALALIVYAHYPEALADKIQNLSLHTGLTQEQVTRAIHAAHAIAGSHQAGPSSLERDTADPATYVIRPEASACIEVHDPNRPGYGYSVSIHADHDGPGIEVWPLAPHQTPSDDDEALDRIDWSFDVIDDLLQEKTHA